MLPVITYLIKAITATIIETNDVMDAKTPNSRFRSSILSTSMAATRIIRERNNNTNAKKAKYTLFHHANGATISDKY